MKLPFPIQSLVLLAFCTSGVQGITIFDDFDDGNDTSPFWNFADVSQGAGSRGFGPDNKRYQITGPATASLRADFNLVNGEVRCEMSNWNPGVSVGSSIGILARFNPNNNSGYFLSIDADGSPSLNLVKLVNGVPADGMGGPTKSYNSNSTYILQLIAAGAKLTCRVYEKGSPQNTLIDEFEWTDPNPFLGGLTGVLVANDDFPNSSAAATAMFDNFFATDGNVNRPNIASPAIVGGNFQLSFGTEPGRTYVVESRIAVTDPGWQHVITYGPKSTSGAETASDPLVTGNQFYQVRVVDDSP